MSSSTATPDADEAPTKQGQVYCSQPFKFIVKSKAFFVHTSLIAKHSKPLDRMIHGSMIEAQQGFATLEDVDQGTFLRSVEWLYHGHYHPAEPRHKDQAERFSHTTAKVEGEVESIHEINLQSIPLLDDIDFDLEKPCEPPEVERTFGSWGGLPSSTKNQANKGSYLPFRRTSPKERFNQRKYTLRNASKDWPQPKPNTQEEDCSEVFLSHARLYVFADKYDIQVLKNLAVEELHATLAVFTMHQQRTGDILSLLRYVYAETRETKAEVEGLRALMIEYMGVEIESLIKDESLGDLMIEDGGPILADFLKVMRKKFA